MKRIKDIKSKLLLTLGYLGCITILYNLGVPCIFQTVFKVPCMGCGVTRALLSVLDFDFVSAFHYHKMFWAVPILYLYFLFDGKLFENKVLNKALFIGIAVGFIVSWIVKLCSAV